MTDDFDAPAIERDAIELREEYIAGRGVPNASDAERRQAMCAGLTIETEIGNEIAAILRSPLEVHRVADLVRAHVLNAKAASGCYTNNGLNVMLRKPRLKILYVIQDAPTDFQIGGRRSALTDETTAAAGTKKGNGHTDEARGFVLINEGGGHLLSPV